MFEHPRQDRFREFIHVLDDEAIPSGTPRNDTLEVRIFEHSERLWSAQSALSNATGVVRTCKASSQNRTSKTLRPRSGHVSTSPVERNLALGPLYGESSATLA